MCDNDSIDSLETIRIVGFNGKVLNGLHVHPDNQNLVYPLGFNLIIENICNHEQSILAKHTNNITCISIDPSGCYIATGQVNYMGFKAPIVLWDYKSKTCIVALKDLHKVKVESLAFTVDSQYLISLGGRDDGAVVVWDLAVKEPLCGSPAQVVSAGITHCLATSLSDQTMFVTGGDNTLRCWSLDVNNRKIRPTEVSLGGGTKRTVTCIEMADMCEDYQYAFCGTSTGDVLVVNLSSQRMQFIVPEKNKLSCGISVISLVVQKHNSCDLLVGTGDGIVARYELRVTSESGRGKKSSATFRPSSHVKPWLDSKLKRRHPVTSIAKRGSGHMFFVGTADCQVYKFNYAEMSASLIKTCHSEPVNDICFAHGFTDLLVTCSKEEIRVWNTLTGTELNRFVEANLTCNAICITRDGRNIFSAWDDGHIRVIGFVKDRTSLVSLKHKFTVKDCHNKGVTAIAVISRGDRVVSGGGEGQVRVWQIHEDPVPCRSHGDMIANMKEHRGKVSCIQIDPKDTLCASTSTDGSTIIWDLQSNTRSQIFLSNTLFKCVSFGAKGDHILTSGTDHKISYWDVIDGSLHRELQGAKTGAINALDISYDGRNFITGGEDQLLKLWQYNEGTVTNIGTGHSDVINKVRICPNQKIIASVSADGAIHLWNYPSTNGDLPDVNDDRQDVNSQGVNVNDE